MTNKNDEKMKEYIESKEQLLKLQSIKVKTSIC